MSEELANLLEEIGNNQLENKLEDEEVRTKKDLAAETFTESYPPGKAFPDSLTVSTSGTTGKSLPIPYHRDYIPRTIETNAQALELMGLTEGDRKFVLGAGFPHISAWAFREGTSHLGAEVLNHSFNDIKFAEDLASEIERLSDQATSLVGLPRIVRKFGETIEEETGSKPSDIFDIMEKGFFVGDRLTSDRRNRLKDQWGLETTREVYGATETDIVACSIDETRRLLPLLDKYILEIVPEDSEEVIDIRNLGGQIRGDLLITDPSRIEVDLTRYRIGDRVEVFPDYEIPRIKILGRDNSVLNLDGAIIYEEGIENALRKCYGTDQTPEWRLVKDFVDDETEDLEVTFYLRNPDLFDPECLYEVAPAVQEVRELDLVRDISAEPLSEYEGPGDGENKDIRIHDKT